MCFCYRWFWLPSKIWKNLLLFFYLELEGPPMPMALGISFQSNGEFIHSEWTWREIQFFILQWTPNHSFQLFHTNKLAPLAINNSIFNVSGRNEDVLSKSIQLNRIFDYNVLVIVRKCIILCPIAYFIPMSLCESTR